MQGVVARWPITNPEACTRFWRALVPNIILHVYVTDQDRDCQPIPQDRFITSFKTAFSALCGGHAPTVGGPDGDYKGQSERTVVVSTCLPEVVTRSLRANLFDLVLDYGVRANQEEVLVVVGVFAHRFRFPRATTHEGDGIALSNGTSYPAS